MEPFAADASGERRRSLESQPTEALAAWIVDVALLWGVAATAGYHLVLLARWPARTWFPLVGVLALGAGFVFRGLRRPTTARTRSWRPNGATLLLLALGLALGGLNLVTLRPDADDFSYLHRALHALQHLASPFAREHTAHDVDGLPPISTVHLLTSVEVTTALVAQALGVPALWALQNGLGFAALFLLAPAGFLVLRFFGCTTRSALLALVAWVAFLAVSGDTHNDWGNFTLVRAWQGKCILVLLHVPLALLFGLRFLSAGRGADLWRLHALAYSGLGLSGTALFLVPFLLGLVTAAVLVLGRARARHLRRAAGLATLLVYPALVALAIALGVLPRVIDDSAWTADTRSAGEVLQQVVSLRDLPLVLVVALVLAHALRPRALARTLVLAMLLGSALLVVPWSGTQLMRLVTPAAYWRLAHALPLPLLVGLALAGLVGAWGRSRTATERGLVWLGGAGLVAGIAWAHEESALAPRVFTGLHSAKLARVPAEVARALHSLVPPGGLVLAPEPIVVALGLLRPDVRFVSTRPVETLHVFTNADQRREGEFRITAQRRLEANDAPDPGGVPVGMRWPALSTVVTRGARGPEALGEDPASGGWHETSVRNFHLWTRARR